MRGSALRVVDYSNRAVRRHDAQAAARAPVLPRRPTGLFLAGLPPRLSRRLLVTWLAAEGTVGLMAEDRAAALQRIPRPYSLALRLRDAGVRGTLIADCLDIEPEALDPLLRLAEAKLAAAQNDDVT